jgi:hypothetical protein
LRVTIVALGQGYAVMLFFSSFGFKMSGRSLGAETSECVEVGMVMADRALALGCRSF